MITEAVFIKASQEDEKFHKEAEEKNRVKQWKEEAKEFLKSNLPA